MFKFTGFTFLAVLLTATSALAQTAYTPENYKVTVYKFEIATATGSWVEVMDEPSGTVIDLADATAFGSNFANSSAIPAGEYVKLRFDVDADLVWTHAAAPISLSNQTFTVTGGPAHQGGDPDKMTVVFATPAQGGKPHGGENEGSGTAASPFLLSQSFAVAASGTTNVKMISYVTDTLTPDGGGGWDLAPPQFFVVADTGNTSSLVGSYNIVFYGSHKDITSDGMGGWTVTGWNYESGYGVLTFASNGTWTASITDSNEFNVVTETGALSGGDTFTGKFGVSTNSFWMLVDGHAGSLKGAFGQDIITAAMLDNSEEGLMFFGTKVGTAAADSNMNSDYYYTTMGNSYDSSGSPSTLEYGGAFGIVTFDGAGGVTGNSTPNRVVVQDPYGTPSSTGPSAPGSEPFSATINVTSTGVLNMVGGDLHGGALENGNAGCFALNFNTTYNAEQKFGFFVKKSADSTFSASDLNGETFAGAFAGDHYESSESESHYFAGHFEITFTSATSATVVVEESLETGITRSTMTVDYTVQANGTVDFQDTGSSVEDPITGAIGPGANYFILYAKATLSDATVVDQRFVGLAVKQ